jgi:hypothetical protein
LANHSLLSMQSLGGRGYCFDYARPSWHESILSGSHCASMLIHFRNATNDSTMEIAHGRRPNLRNDPEFSFNRTVGKLNPMEFGHEFPTDETICKLYFLWQSQKWIRTSDYGTVLQAAEHCVGYYENLARFSVPKSQIGPDIVRLTIISFDQDRVVHKSRAETHTKGRCIRSSDCPRHGIPRPSGNL